jgi:hypothetical protein
MNIFLIAEVHCTDGAGGNATALVLNPVTKVATHLVIDPKGHGHDWRFGRSPTEPTHDVIR